MELKDFIKQVIQEVTDAVTESQMEITNGSVVAPSLSEATGDYISMINNKKLSVSKIEFDVSVELEESSHTDKGVKGDLKIVSAKAENTTLRKDLTTHRIKFDVPVVFPSGLGRQQRKE